MIDIDFKNFQEIQQALSQELPSKILQMGEVAFQESVRVAKAITPIVIAAELSFIGFRVMFRAPIVEQLTHFTRKLIICYFMVYTSLVTGLFVGSDSIQENLKSAGLALGGEILKISPKAPSSPEPIAYWGEWMGDAGGAGKNKFDFAYQYEVLFQSDPLIPKAIPGSNLNSSTSKSGTAKSTGIMDPSSYFYLITLPMMAIGNVIATAGIQISAFMAPLFTGIGILHGSTLALHLILSLGICMVPLMFFHQFERIFTSYLHILVAVALIPPLFYLLSAVGFVLSTQTYEIVVVKKHLAYDLYQLFAGVAEQTIDQMINNVAPGSDFGLVKETLKEMILYYGAYLCGSMVVAAFIMGGVTISAASVSLAMRWNQAFADEGMIRAFSGFFSRIEGSFVQGLSQGMNSGTQGMGSLFGSLRGGKK